jgi:hypothetical protein
MADIIVGQEVNPNPNSGIKALKVSAAGNQGAEGHAEFIWEA